MKKPLCFVTTLALLAGAVASCTPPAPDVLTTSRPAASPAPAPQKQTDEPLLLLDDLPESAMPTPGMADNHRCKVCHLNLAQEALALSHARAGVGCAKCHGESDEHIADESWASGGNGTAPDIMFPKPQINPGCLECHPRAELDRDAHQEFLAGNSEEKYCTDCHGEHRIVNRKCKWK